VARLGVWLAAVALLSGCAAHRRAADRTPAELEAFIEKVRHLSMTAKPARPNEAATLEMRDPRLAAARALLAEDPSPEHYRLVAESYARLGVGDAAYDHFMRAIGLNPRDASAYDGLARVWRNWGFPHLGLSDAHRAVFYAPDSPIAHNTLGTLLLDLGLVADARTAFERALALDGRAVYALNNLCYAYVMQGNHRSAIAACQRALDAEPTLVAAHINLGLAYVAAGDVDAGSREFSVDGDAATARYNLGVALLATRRFHDAARAFDQAVALKPSIPLGRQRAEQARQLAKSAAAGTP